MALKLCPGTPANRLVLPLAAALLVFATLSARQAPVPDLVIVNGRVFTGVESQKWVEAVAIAGERIAAVGTTATVKATAGPATRVIDARGRLVIPGINDAHVHPSALPAHTRLEGPHPMEHDPTLAEVLVRVKTAAAKAPGGGWIIGEIGANVLFDPRATRFTVDEISGDHPVVLGTWHGHGTLFNTAALRRLGVSETEADPPGGRFLRMPGGRTITGLTEEYADFSLRRRLTMLPDEEAQIRAYQRFAEEAVAFGITSAQAMMTGYPVEQAAALMARAKLPIRMRLIDFPMTAPAKWIGAAGGAESPTLSISGVKYIVDGTPVERLMFLREPYSDDPGTRGRLNFEASEIRTFLARAMSARVQPMFHATGDAAIDVVLGALEASGGERWLVLRPRIEHGDMLEPGQFERAKRMGVILVQNPSHFMLADMMQARLGDRRSRTTMVGSALRAGVPFALGSDGPLNPFLNIMFASINPTNPSEALTIEESLVAYTRGSAAAELMEARKGTLAPGKLADLAILSQDIFSVPPPELPKTTSVMTIVGGRVVHDANAR